MENLDIKTVADVVTENIKTAHVFKKHGIDFCCGGGISIKKACEKNNVDFDTIVAELNQLENKTSYATDYNNWELDFLIDFIVNTHHKYVEENLTLLKQYGDRVAKVHGHHYTELLEIKDLIHEVSDELAAHMKKEELILFPFIKKLVQAIKNNTPIEKPHFGTVNNPIKMMEEEHDKAGDIFKRISELTDKYQTPEGACNTFKALYSKLEEFEDDLHQHVHLENNILFPKAIKLEASL
ncbi:MAG: iron-sulfur cluster repair di-iron protein [Flavobacteriaceae bacterium]|nr:iron-sulfur cluster repair di-iron protein [Flavobacteriaceae bacterium]